jgi:hypothetical protein
MCSDESVDILFFKTTDKAALFFYIFWFCY